jgi:N-ATPase, AtpR subunit
MTHNTILMAVAGLAFGVVYFASLKRSVTLFVGGRGWLGPLALILGRIGAAVAFLFIAAKLGAAPLPVAFIGFLMARALALRAERRTG